MLLIAAPAIALRLGSSDAGNDPASQTTREAYDLLAEGFGAGFNGPLLRRREVPRANAPARTRARCRLHDRAARPTPGVVVGRRRQAQPRGRRRDDYRLSRRSSPQAYATTQLVDTTCATTCCPPVERAAPARTVYVGGVTAGAVDFADVARPQAAAVHRRRRAAVGAAADGRLPLAGDPAAGRRHEPAQSIGAALGVIVADLPVGLAGRPVRRRSTGPIESFIPVMLFAIVFGLSMDYEVFLVSRIHEEWTHTRDTLARGRRRARR